MNLKQFDSDDVGLKKKTDEPTPDDPHNSSDESEETEEEQLDEGDEEPPKLENEVFSFSYRLCILETLLHFLNNRFNNR